MLVCDLKPYAWEKVRACHFYLSVWVCVFVCVCMCVRALHSEPPFHSDYTDTLIIQSYRRWCKTDEGTQGCAVSIFHYIQEVRETDGTEHKAPPLHPPLVITSNQHAIITETVSEGWHQGHFSAKKTRFVFIQTNVLSCHFWMGITSNSRLL